jgi:hypothetical protein
MIYDFIELKYFVKQRLGVDPDSVNSNFKPITQKLTRAELEKNVEFNTDGIFFVDKKGNKHKGFLYIEAGYSRVTAQRNGWRTIVPKFHVANCETIQQKKKVRDFDGKYVFSNEIIEMEDIDGLTKELQICENCVKMQRPVVYSKMNTSEFKEEVILNGEDEGNFLDNELPKDVTTEFWGYTPEWHEASKNFRMKNRFTCQDCGIPLNQNMANGYYLETHHVDGNKKNNDDDNLKCLCVLCHANVDDAHRENYSRGSTRQKLRDFINLFEDELRRVGNKYLDRYK